MELVVIGSGTIAPSSKRTAPAHWVTIGDIRLLFECGAGTLHRAATLGLPWAEVTHVAVTHFHVDHWGELPALLFALKWGIEPARKAPLTLIGPMGFRARLTLMAGALGDWVLDPGYPLEIIEIRPGIAHNLADGVSIEACKTPHTETPVLTNPGESGVPRGLAMSLMVKAGLEHLKRRRCRNVLATRCVQYAENHANDGKRQREWTSAAVLDAP